MDLILVKPKSEDDFLLVQSILKRMKVETEVFSTSTSKETILEGIELGVREVVQAEKDGIKLESLDEFLNELSHPNN